MPTPMRSRVVAADMKVLREKGKRAGWEATEKQRSDRETPVRFLRGTFGEVILVISGQSRRMYQSLEPKIGGNNLIQEV